MKKVLVIDARMIGQIRHGIASYVEGIASSLKDGDPLTDTLTQSILVKSINELDIIFLVTPYTPSTSPVFKFKTVVMNVSCYHPKSWIEVPKALKSVKADLFFNPTFASYPYLPCAYVQTVHDLNHLHFGNFAQKLYYQTLLRNSLQDAKWIFTVSNTVKKELVNWAKTNPDKIKVFYNRFETTKKVDSSIEKVILLKYKLEPKKYFLCVSNDKKHKNTKMLMDAHQVYFSRKKKDESKPQDKILEKWTEAFFENEKSLDDGGGPLPLVLTLKQNSAWNESVRRIGNVDDQILSVLLQNCAGFYFPSLYEGFGRPPIEAALNGVKYIVVSDIPVHHEAESLSDIPFKFIKVTE